MTTYKSESARINQIGMAIFVGYTEYDAILNPKLRSYSVSFQDKEESEEDEHTEELLDEALEEPFPASDPIAIHNEDLEEDEVPENADEDEDSEPESDT